jgi:dolichol-phosphate mannosyltransferase
MLRIDVHDMTAGFRAYRSDLLARIDVDTVGAEGYGFQIEMTHRVARVGGRIVEVPIKFVDRVRGTSKMSSAIIAEAMALVTWWGIRDRVWRRKP